MKITIKYCGMCLYEASGLEAAIRENTIIDDIDLRQGSGGGFDVFVDGVRIYSKEETGKFPTHEDILDKIILYDIGKTKCGLEA